MEGHLLINLSILKWNFKLLTHENVKLKSNKKVAYAER